MTRIFFATDIHGSEKCWRKFINAGQFYKADIIILGGDMTGKAIIPIVEKSDGTHKVSFLEQEVVLRGEKEVAQMERTIVDRGYYPLRASFSKVEELNADPKKVEELFVQMAVQTVERWLDYAEKRLKGTGIKCYVCPGNDDMFEIDEVIEGSKYVFNAEGKVIELDPIYKMISTGWSTPTPWNTFRECSEEELQKKIQAMAYQVEDMSRCIFNLHDPPYGSGLDEAPELDAQLRPKYAGRSTVAVGSKAVKEAVEKHQPLLGLFGHIHEAKGLTKIGRTTCINPGSSYEQGILLGVLVDLDSRGIHRYLPTSG
ncbi:uncharacterized protein HKBW3S43_00258 [Candidatus Hakubella thermalkaliphila]|uniref:Calcineurin-like phosphoesterase domain-containing protein n=4 Tax=Candidatus Hakubella thermalkaliphila TaxID=2754717 RepID=A0A6V8PP82_9ACTN|nr:metallophosphoesterase [Candidatus Hakubella thermalkaliphila]GFP34465.1 uncharacterized protein HKBW3S43_00258 [Candidatus Hakubella thermalkaliphila]GFP42936.1 uncharacterized protein HKBW3C_02068 [Candidatus Hakubella thermalkaliphila]